MNEQNSVAWCCGKDVGNALAEKQKKENIFILVFFFFLIRKQKVLYGEKTPSLNSKVL